ncbi:MAG: T9SS type A sorting domain-containing protein, partial [Paludibacter sp.]
SVDKHSNISIYPNPLLDNQLTIDGLLGKSTIYFINIGGSIVKEQEVRDQQRIQINVNLLPGVYFVKIMGAKGTSVQKLIIGVN